MRVAGMSEPDAIAVVGGGQSAKYLLLALSHAIASGRLSAEGLRIAVYEEGDACGPGFAWNPANMHEAHLSSLARPVRRARVGQDELRRFPLVVAYLRELGAQVTVLCGRRVARIDRDLPDWRLTLADGGTGRARHVVLAIGHHAYGLKTPDGINCLSPWPFDEMSARIAARSRSGMIDVLVLGSYLTAVDVVTGLAARFGLPDARHGAGSCGRAAPLRMHLVSRSGQLPKVWGAEPPVLDQDAAVLASLGASLDSLRRNGRFGFEEFSRVALDAARAGTDATPPSAGACGASHLALRVYLESLCAGDPAQRLKRDIAEAQGSDASGPGGRPAALAWQYALFGCLPLLSEMFPYFSDSDKLRFASIRSRYYSAAMPMALENARLIDALFDSGNLSITGAPRGYRLHHDKGGDTYRVEIDGACLPKTFSVVIAASGPDTCLSRAASPLLKHLYESGMALPVLAMAAADREDGSAPDRHMPPAELGGVRVRPATCEMISADPAVRVTDGRMFAMGPLVVGTYPDAQSIGHIARDAERIVDCLCSIPLGSSFNYEKDVSRAGIHI